MSRGHEKAKNVDPLMAVLEPALRVGALSGAAGLLVGGTAGLTRSSTPGLFATASGIQTFALGSTYWATRGTILYAWDTGKQTPRDRVNASAIAGGISGGALGFLFRGRSNAIPGALMFSLFGWAGQSIYNRLDAPKAAIAPEDRKPGFWRRLADRSWSPVKVMNNDEYAQLLRDKMLRVDVEIAVLDDKIEALRKQQQEQQQREAQLQQSATPEKA